MVTRGAPSETTPERRVVLLGASNLARSLPAMLRICREKRGAPLDFLTAIGHGRSYGVRHRVLGRSLPGILECGLWEALEKRPPAATAALLTDIGNDIAFGSSVEQIADWVEQCLSRLRPFAERIVITELPLPSIILLGPKRFFLVRRILFPKSRLTLDQAVQKACALNERVRDLAEEYGAVCAAHDASWYGLDPIHIRRRHYERAWREVLDSWNDTDAAQRNERFSLFFKAQLRLSRPAQRWLIGIEQKKIQPALRLRDGSSISMY